MTDAIFQAALSYTLRFEGGFVDDPVDHGGATKYGITVGTLRQEGKGGDLNMDGLVDARDVSLLTKERAEAIYRQRYWLWDKLGGIDLSKVSPALMMKHFDIAVNCGTKAAAYLLQRAINLVCSDAASPHTVVADGEIGQATVNALSALPPGKVMTALCAVQADRYEGIVAKDEHQRKFLNGWLKRAASIPAWEG